MTLLIKICTCLPSPNRNSFCSYDFIYDKTKYAPSEVLKNRISAINSQVKSFSSLIEPLEVGHKESISLGILNASQLFFYTASGATYTNNNNKPVRLFLLSTTSFFPHHFTVLVVLSHYIIIIIGLSLPTFYLTL